MLQCIVQVYLGNQSRNNYNFRQSKESYKVRVPSSSLLAFKQFYVNNKSTRTTLLASLFFIFIVDFKHFYHIVHNH